MLARTRRLLPLAALGAVAALGLLAWRASARAEASARFSELAVCLAGGPERVGPEEAAVRTRRLHGAPRDPSLDLCTRLASDLAGSRLVRTRYPRLVEEARAFAARGPDGDRDPTDLWGAAEELSWAPPPTLRGAPIPRAPAPLLDAALAGVEHDAIGRTGIDLAREPAARERSGRIGERRVEERRGCARDRRAAERLSLIHI